MNTNQLSEQEPKGQEYIADAYYWVKLNEHSKWWQVSKFSGKYFFRISSTYGYLPSELLAIHPVPISEPFTTQSSPSLPEDVEKKLREEALLSCKDFYAVVITQSDKEHFVNGYIAGAKPQQIDKREIAERAIEWAYQEMQRISSSSGILITSWEERKEKYLNNLK